MKFDNYYLDLDKISKMESKTEKEQIHNYYREMMFSFIEGREEMGKSILNTLLNGGFLVDSRDKKLDEILGDEQL